MTPETEQALREMAAYLCPDCKRGRDIRIGAERYDANGHEWWHGHNGRMWRCKAECFHEALHRLGPGSTPSGE